MNLRKEYLKKRGCGDMFKLILEFLLAVILGVCVTAILLYSFVAMIPVIPIIIIFIIAYRIYNKIT